MRWIACSLTWMSVSAAVMYAISQTGRMACLWFLVVPALVDWSLTKETTSTRNPEMDWYAGPKTKEAIIRTVEMEKEESDV